jgi:tetratricopeptide (TPR) repeat protein
MSVVFHNQGELAASTGNLTEAETLYRQSLNLAERVNDREYLSLWNADLATVLQEQGKLEETRTYVHRALTIGRAIRNVPCIGNALVALGNLHIAQAKAVSEGQTVEGEEKRTHATKHFLMRARSSLKRALVLQGLEVETRTRGHLALAQVSLLSGELETARRQAIQAMEEARRYELAALLARCQRLLDEVAENGEETTRQDA